MPHVGSKTEKYIKHNLSKVKEKRSTRGSGDNIVRPSKKSSARKRSKMKSKTPNYIK